MLRLDAESLNCVAYVTTKQGRPPTTIAPTLNHFLNSILNPQFQDDSLQAFGEMVSPDSLAQSAERAVTRASTYLSDPEVFFTRSQTQEVLEPLKQLFEVSNLSAFGAIVGGDSRNESDMARALSKAGLPCFRVETDKNNLEVLDPLLPVQMLADVAIPYPQCVFWSKQGAACHLPIDLGKQLCNDLIEARHNSEGVHQIIQQARRKRMRAATILHLSDLHYGRIEPVDQEQYLLAHLASVVPTVDRIVITGDLCNNPFRKNLAAFNNFRKQLERMGKEVVVIPGNHDARISGNSIGKLGRLLGMLTQLDWPRMPICDDLRLVFFCFDSSRHGIGARGRIEDSDLQAMATNYDIKVQNDPEIDSYFKIALIHHHPFTFDGTRNLLQSAWSKATLEDDIYLRLERAEEFVAWCQNKGVRAILHGHKHIPKWFIRDGVNPISAIGCGSTAGIDGDLSYVIVAVDSLSKRHSASFYRGAKDGTGFEPMFMTATFI
jgi:UDP-2,3-diacylglucosamine pyrophosphatase LpxH